MAQNNNLTSLNGFFKEVYAAKMNEIIPEGTKLLKSIPFVPRERQNGSLYHQPVVLGLEHGVTFATSGDAFALNAAVAGATKDAQVQGSQMVLRSILSYTAAARALGSDAKAFGDATKFLVGNMTRSIGRKLELQLLYGQVGYGIVGSVSSNTITMTTAEWAPGVWAGSEGMPLQIMVGTSGSQRGYCNVVSVDMTAQTVTVDSMPASVANGDVIYHGAAQVSGIAQNGAYGNEFVGIHKMLTTSGSLWNIDNSTYALWKGNTISAGSAALTYALINQAVARCVEKGAEGDLVLHVNPRTWGNLLNDQAALRRYDSSYKSAVVETGAEEITFHSQNGKIKIVSNLYVKQGYAYLISTDDMIRVGSTDITFKRPGNGEDFFRDLEQAAGYELRAFTDQALFCAAPGRLALITGIVNS